MTGAGGVFSVATNAAGVAATTLASNPAGGRAGLPILPVAAGRAYVTIQNPTGVLDALQINTDGTSPVTTTNANWAGGVVTTSFDFEVEAGFQSQSIFLSTRSGGNDTFSVIDAQTGAPTGVTLGTINSTLFAFAVGIGRYAPITAFINRGAGFDVDVFIVDALTPGSLIPLATTVGAPNDRSLLFN